MADTWRVRDASGVAHVVPTPRQERWGWSPGLTWVVDQNPMRDAHDAHDAVALWAIKQGIRAREIAEPGQLFTHEQVEATQARVVGLLRWWCNFHGEAAGHLNGSRSAAHLAFARGIASLLERIEKGESAPATDPKAEAIAACRRAAGPRWTIIDDPRKLAARKVPR